MSWGRQLGDLGENGRAAELEAGTVLDGRYRLERFLGAGGMGAVWVGWQLALEREVAVKVLQVASPASHARLRREALALAAVHHPAVVGVYDYGETASGVPYVVMELVRGEGLAHHLARRGALPCEEAVALVLPLLDGLAVAHGAGVVHRDIKPENVVFVSGPAGDALKLLDFGIARVARPDDDAVRVTADGGLLGTPSYMAPEQVRGEATDARTDVWGMGALLYEMLAGEAPFGFDEVFVVIARVLGHPPSYPRGAEGLDGRLWGILTTALRKDPAERHPSATALREALAGWLETRLGPVSSVVAVESLPADAQYRPLDAAIARLAPTMLAPHAPHAPHAARSTPPPPRGADAEDEAPPSFDGLIRTKLSR